MKDAGKNVSLSLEDWQLIANYKDLLYSLIVEYLPSKKHLGLQTKVKCSRYSRNPHKGACVSINLEAATSSFESSK